MVQVVSSPLSAVIDFETRENWVNVAAGENVTKTWIFLINDHINKFKIVELFLPELNVTFFWAMI